jgi:hypothetical protein
MRSKNWFYLFFLFISSIPAQLDGIFAINLFRPWDINLRPPRWCGENVQETNWFEIGLKARGINAKGDFVNEMQLWTKKQDALAMLHGFGDASEITHYLKNTLMNPEDNGVRGNFKVKGDFKARAFGFNFRYHLPYDFTIGFLVPFYAMQLSRVDFQDLTQDLTSEDIIVKEKLTSILPEVINMFDPSLKLTGWRKIGFGDLCLLTEWYRDFPQGKPILKNVALNARFGLNVPTGIKVDEDDIFSVPFGCDGAFSIVFGGGINLNWWDAIHGGIDIEFINIFGNTRNRRIKVDSGQTEFLLLAKTPTHKEFGFTQRFNLYLEAWRFYQGLSARATYQFWKKGNDTLTLCTNIFPNNIPNSAQSIQEWTIHQFIFQLAYDAQGYVDENAWFKPQVSLFYKLPFNGQRALLNNTVGATLTVNF